MFKSYPQRNLPSPPQCSSAGYTSKAAASDSSEQELMLRKKTGGLPEPRKKCRGPTVDKGWLEQLSESILTLRKGFQQLPSRKREQRTFLFASLSTYRNTKRFSFTHTAQLRLQSLCTSLHLMVHKSPRGTAPAPAWQYIWLHTAVIPAVALHHLTLAVESTTGEAICASLWLTLMITYLMTTRRSLLNKLISFLEHEQTERCNISATTKSCSIKQPVTLFTF